MKEDYYKSNSIQVEMSHSGITLKFPMRADFYKKYFRQRVEPLTKTGRKRPILHNVARYFRDNDIKVKGHERGIRQFNIEDIVVKIQQSCGDYSELLTA